jgi:hypothetical protein
MNKVTGIKTEVGLLEGRDAIYLDKIVFDGDTKVTLIGELNLDQGDKKFEMIFGGVIYFSAIELDFDDRGQMESLGTIDNSERLKIFRTRDHSRKTNSKHRHYYIRTYDTVFDIVGDRFEFTVKT